MCKPAINRLRKALRHQNNLINIIGLLILLISVKGYSQDNDSLRPEKIQVNNFFEQIGINSFSFNSSNYPEYLISSSGETSPLFNFSSSFTIDSGSNKPNKLSYSNTNLSPNFGTGVGFIYGKIKNIVFNHFIGINYMQTKGQYSYSDYYKEYASFLPQWSYITDTVQSRFVQNAISLNYTFQPTYKVFFISFGLNCNINFVNVNSSKKEQEVNWFYGEGPNTNYEGTKIMSKNFTSNFTYLNFPLQLGAGAKFSFNKLSIQPALYYIPYFMKGYSIYNASVRLVYSFSK